MKLRVTNPTINVDYGVWDLNDLVSFGEYLLSEERTNRIKSFHKPGDPIPVEERLREVYHADVENWMEQERIKRDKHKTDSSG